MPKDDAFAGIKLSEQVGPASVEQRLFSVQRPSPPPTPKTARPENQETKKPGNREVGKEVSQEIRRETNQEVAREAKPHFDLDRTPTRKDSFLFTEEEFEAFEDLKIEFRRKHDLKITKNDLARCALHLLVEDYRENRERSFLGRRFLNGPAKR